MSVILGEMLVNAFDDLFEREVFKVFTEFGLELLERVFDDECGAGDLFLGNVGGEDALKSEHAGGEDEAGDVEERLVVFGVSLWGALDRWAGWV